MEKCYQILKVNLKHNLFKHLLIILIFFLISPLIMGMKNLEESQVAQVLQMYVSFFGTIILIPLFIPDEDLSIRYLLLSKKQSMIITHLIRLMEQIILLLGAAALFMLIFKLENCTFDFSKLFFGVTANCLFLGGLGILGYSIINSLPFAYMVSIFYYILCYGCGQKILGKFYLFSMSSGIYDNNIYIFCVGILMIVLGIVYRDIIMKIRN